VLAAEPKLLDKVRDEFADQQSLHYSADRNRNFYIAGDPEDLRAAAQTFDKMFEQTIPTLKTPTPVRLAPQTQPSNATSLEPRERTAPNSLLKREPVQSQSAKPIDEPAVTSGNGSKVIGQTGNVPRFPGKPPLPAPQVTIGNVQPNGADVRGNVGNAQPKIDVANLGPKTANVGPNLGKQIPGTSGARVVGGNVVPQTTVSTLQPKTGNVAPTLSNPQDTNAPPKTIPPPIPVRPQRPGGTSPNALVAENKLTASVPVPTNRVAELKAKLDHNHIIQGHK
jgi:hypothetical protein